MIKVNVNLKNLFIRYNIKRKMNYYESRKYNLNIYNNNSGIHKDCDYVKI